MALPLSADENPLELTFYGSFLHSGKVPDALFFFSKIEKHDSFELRKALRNHNINKIILSSGGGSVFEGLQMAGIIHDKGLTTYIPKTGLYGNGNCASACAFMFFGGDTRVIGGVLGVHQFYSQDSKAKAEVSKVEEEALFTVSEIIGFLNEFQTPPFVFEKMFQQSNMYYFDDNENLLLENKPDKLDVNTIEKIEIFIEKLVVEFKKQEQKEETVAVSKQDVQVIKKTCAQDAKSCDEVQLCKRATYNSRNSSNILVKKWRNGFAKQPYVSEAKKRGLYCNVGERANKKQRTNKEIIKAIQYQLNRLGCNAGGADGILGGKTISAFQKWKTVSGSYLNNIYDINLLEELKKSSNKCSSVKSSQESKTTLKTKNQLMCWDRNINAAVSSFTSRKAAESWFPSYVYITDEIVQWGEDEDNWYVPQDNVGNSYSNAKSNYQGNVFILKYGKKYNRLTVVMGNNGNYRTVPPVMYMKCEHN